MCSHGRTLGYGIYNENYSSVSVVTLVIWNLEHCLFNEFHSKGLISIPTGCSLCVFVSAMQRAANKAQHSHLSKILITLQWEKILHFTRYAILHVPLISIHYAPRACLMLSSTELVDWAQISTEAKAILGVEATQKVEAGVGDWGGELKLHSTDKTRTKRVFCRLGQF